jgi:hypothetical protein
MPSLDKEIGGQKAPNETNSLLATELNLGS